MSRPATFSVEIAPAARRQIRKLEPSARRKIVRRLEELQDAPRPPGCKQLSGPEKLFRVRIGEYRVIYRVEDQKLIVLVLKVGHRRDVYRRGLV